MAAALAILLATSTLFGFLGRGWWVLDLVANLRPQQAVLLLGLAVLLLAVGSYRVAAVATIAAAINLALLAPFLATSPPHPVPASADTLEISFLNVKRVEADPAAVIADLRRTDSDLAMLATATPDWVGAIEDAGLDLHLLSGPHLTSGLELIVLARDPDLDVRVHQPMPEKRSALVEVTVDLDGTPVHVLVTHPVSPLTSQRASRRDAHLAWVATWARQRTEPVVVVGDLNATPWSPTLRWAMGYGDLVDSQRTAGLQPSWPAVLGPAGLPIDHVLHSPSLTTLERRLGPSFGSDHRSVRATLASRSSVE